MSEKYLENLRQMKCLSKEYDTDHYGDKLNRYFGGKRKHSPFVTGYFYVILEPPAYLFKNKQKFFTDYVIVGCHNFTPPSFTINDTEIVGFNGIKVYAITNFDISGTFTLGIEEHSNTPFFHMLKIWTGILNPYFGGYANKDIKFKDYKGKCLVIHMKPTFSEMSELENATSEQDIEEIFFFDGVFPTSYPLEAFGQDISNNELLNYSISFRFDGNVLNKDVIDTKKVFEIMKSYNIRENYLKYNEK